MDLNLPESIQLESSAGDRLILARSGAGPGGFVTVDFQLRRWQLGNHPDRMLNPGVRPYQGRGWREHLVGDAAQALLACPGTGGLASGPAEAAPARPAEPHTAPPAAPEPRAESSAPSARAYAWKLLASGEISQAVSADSPEALFQLAGFRPHRVQDPIQGFLAVAVQRQGQRWVELGT